MQNHVDMGLTSRRNTVDTVAPKQDSWEALGMGTQDPNLNRDQLTASLFYYQNQRVELGEQVKRLDQTIAGLEMLLSAMDGTQVGAELETPTYMASVPLDWEPRPRSHAERVRELLAQHPAGLKFTEIRDALAGSEPDASIVEAIRSAAATLVKYGWAEKPDKYTYRLKPERTEPR